MSAGSPKYPELFPIAYGNEEETMMMAGAVDAPPSQFHTAREFLSSFGSDLPKDVRAIRMNSQLYTQSGHLYYPTGSDTGLLEGATPECATPDEIATAIQARERTVIAMVGNYVALCAKTSNPQEMRIQRRTVDGIGNSAASHDNFEMRRPNWAFQYFGSEAPRSSATRLSLLSHAATRSFMTGAGYVNENGVYYAQKAQTVTRLEGYGYFSSVYRVTSAEDTGARFELRNNDDNISPWAIQERVGGTALVLTALQTELMSAIRSRIPKIMDGKETERLRAFKLFNQAYLDSDGSLKADRFTHEAVDFQEWQFELMGRHLGKYVELDSEHRAVIEEAIQYCHDFRRVIAGDAELSLLADRSDNAAKFLTIAKSIERDSEMGFDRSVTDIKSQMVDMRYDIIRVRPGLGGQARVELGHGYKLRDKGLFKNKQSDEAVERAMYHPPTSTRAHIRGNLIRKGKVAKAEWSNVTVAQGAEGLENLSGEKVPLRNVVLSPVERTLSPEEYLHQIPPLKAPGIVFRNG